MARVSWHQKSKPYWILIKQEVTESDWSGNGISWTICK